ncbi:uncharacterized protein LOC123959580 isoform X2 [Micropterus dolomieu]|uniref:uncharacterized protein LOC123959580 isoform X2 n=2 Tax=Micropterus dolomieu TaxID=147949 RepID=UPI001E8E8055|nr:uncharacterized protein LOC123959580 isoform X2 [Micropterus dolomieu]
MYRLGACMHLCMTEIPARVSSSVNSWFKKSDAFNKLSGQDSGNNFQDGEEGTGHLVQMSVESPRREIGHCHHEGQRSTYTTFTGVPDLKEVEEKPDRGPQSEEAEAKKPLGSDCLPVTRECLVAEQRADPTLQPCFAKVVVHCEAGDWLVFGEVWLILPPTSDDPDWSSAPTLLQLLSCLQDRLRAFSVK